MWKKVAALMGSVVFGLSVSTASLAADAPYEEGVNYEVRTDKLTPYKEIREFFSFWCGHCFALQGDFDRIKAYKATLIASKMPSLTLDLSAIQLRC